MMSLLGTEVLGRTSALRSQGGLIHCGNRVLQHHTTLQKDVREQASLYSFPPSLSLNSIQIKELAALVRLETQQPSNLGKSHWQML